MLQKTFFSTPKGVNKWYFYIVMPIYGIILAIIFSFPIFSFKAKPNTYLSYLQFLVPSAMLVFSTFILLKWMHKRSGYTLINAIQIRWKRIFWAMAFFGSITVFIELLLWALNPSDYILSFDKTTFFQYLLVSLVLIPLQATGEELMCRGYLLQGIAWATKRPWVAIIITSLLFGSLHLANPEIKTFGYVFILNYILMGLAAGIMTVMDDGAELSIGVHIINNLYSAIIVTYPSSVLKTSTLFTIDKINVTMGLIALTLSFLGFLIICQKKYHWGSFKTLFEKLED